MNARQKAKYWKKRYIELTAKPIKPNIVYSEHKIETLRYDKIISDEIYKMGLDNPELQKKIFCDVMNELAEQAKSFVDLSVEKDIFNCGMRIKGQLSIVRPFHDYHDIYNTHWDVMHDKRENNGGMRKE